MDESDFEGTLVLEKLAEIGQLDSFFEAVDSDDLVRARRLMIRAGIDTVTLHEVLKLMSESSD